MKLVKEKVNENAGIAWSGKDPTKAPVIGKIITKAMDLGGFRMEYEEYEVVEITGDGQIYVVNSWYKPGVPQLIHKQMVDEYIEY